MNIDTNRGKRLDGEMVWDLTDGKVTAWARWTVTLGSTTLW